MYDVIILRLFRLLILFFFFLHLRYGPDDLPVLPCQTWGSDSHFGLLGTAFGVHVGATFLSICSAGKDDISHWCTKITMMTWKVTTGTLKLEGTKLTHFPQQSTLTIIVVVILTRNVALCWCKMCFTLYLKSLVRV